MTTPVQPVRPASGFSITYADVLVAAGGLIVFFFSFAPLISDSVNSWHLSLSVFIVLAAHSAHRHRRGRRGVAARASDRRPAPPHRAGGPRALRARRRCSAFAIVRQRQAPPSVGAASSCSSVALIAAAGAILNHFNKLQTTLAIPTGGSNTGAPTGYVPPQGGYSTPPTTTSADPTTPIPPAGS